jgi:hypothetical protein
VARYAILFFLSAILCAPLHSQEAKESPRQFIEMSSIALRFLQHHNEVDWGMPEAESFSVDQETGRIVFYFRDGKTVSAPVQIVGTFSQQAGSFMWAAENPSMDESLTRASRSAREWAEANGLAEWSNSSFPSSEAEAWEITAVAARLDGAFGAFRAPTDGPIVFLVFGDVEAAREQADEVPPLAGSAQLLSRYLGYEIEMFPHGWARGAVYLEARRDPDGRLQISSSRMAIVDDEKVSDIDPPPRSEEALASFIEQSEREGPMWSGMRIDIAQGGRFEAKLYYDSWPSLDGDVRAANERLLTPDAP